jgi:preprotein translocase subunit SecD
MIQSLQWRIAIIVAVLAVGLFLVYPSFGPVPKWWSKYLPSNSVRLGLDLQGGLYLMLEVEAEKAVEALVDQAASETMAQMKEAKIRYNDVVRSSPTGMTIFLKDADQEPQFDSTVLGKLENFRKVSSGPGDKGFEILLQLDPKQVELTKQRAVRQSVDTIRNRVDQFGVAEPDVVSHGEDRILVQLPGLQEDINRAVEIIKQTARLEFKLVDDKGNLNEALKGDIPPGDEILYQLDRNPRTGSVTRKAYLIKKQILLTGDVITDAKVQPGQVGRLEVHLEFNRQGARTFERVTTEHVKEKLAIILDNRIYSAPEIREPITGGSARIEGMFSPEEAHDLALVLRAGSLPAPVKILENRAVGPSLGEDSIRLGRNAILLGVFLVVLGMVIYYKWSGVVADVALILNPLLILAVMVSPVLRATLTLPGLAGIALTMGMAVDANVLIFERVREELRGGKSARVALENGYAKALSVIWDSNLTTIIATLPLIQFGTGPIQGFAVTLAIGLVISLFTALFVTRTIFDYVFRVKRLSHLSI